MKCPTCAADLLMTDRQGVEIDYCPSCRGVWLDRGELDKIIERSAQYYVPHSHHDDNFPQYDASKKQQATHRFPERKKKGSFLEELFDFDD